jgi:hypothetical protein
MEEEKKELTIEERVKKLEDNEIINDTSYLRMMVFDLQNENRKLTERLNEYEYLFNNLENRFNDLETHKLDRIREDCMRSVSTLIQNISSDYINNYTIAGTS